jgi:hypothetical protein
MSQRAHVFVSVTRGFEEAEGLRRRRVEEAELSELTDSHGDTGTRRDGVRPRFARTGSSAVPKAGAPPRRSLRVFVPPCEIRVLRPLR